MDASDSLQLLVVTALLVAGLGLPMLYLAVLLGRPLYELLARFLFLK